MDQLISSSPLDETVAEPKVAPSALLPKEPVEVGNQLADTRLARSSDAPPLDKTPTKPASVAPTTTGSLPEISGIGTPSKTPVTTSAVSQTEIPTTKLWSDPETGISLAFIPGGCFSMGSEQESENENPVHEVCLDSFWMGVHEITQKQWRQVLNWLPEQSVLDDRFPVGNVSWQGVDEFLQAINKRSGIHFRLPTEAQWEYACTGGGLDKFYCGEGAVQELGWVEENSDHRPHAPGELVSNRFGLYDMTGNLWEWVADWYGADYYRHSPQRNPTGPASGTSRVFRGGGWLSKAGVIRATMRHDMDPHRSYPLMGLRLAAPRVLGVP
ncbi:MAG TPA: SUMF1/EgtB/PvdO family nonheme iron enzyme [Magnetococcales bacterium]|nr:SUMF1/EgtB/PvdO family nonheme iron enzyme [Magnetococcales bacterium]